MARKRDLAYQQELMVEQPYNQLEGLRNSRDYWNSKAWDWDCNRFVAQRVDGNAMDLDTPRNGIMGEDDGRLCLKLGSGTGGLSCSDEGMVRPSKRVAGSPPVGNGAKMVGGSGNGNRPSCQVDNCTVDLSNAKDYHRRHKVCEAHSKATEAMVVKQKQRFCQQCSRFHALLEFDEGKRSCRRRLAGHNRRRRKQQPDDVTSQLLSAAGQEITLNAEFNLVNLLSALARAQGNQDIVKGTPASLPNQDQLVKLISKINSVPPTEATSKLPTSDNLEITSQASPEHQSRSSANSSSQTTLNLLGAPSPGSVPNECRIPYQRSSDSRSSDSEKTKSADTYHQPDPLIRKHQTTLELSSIVGERSSNSCHFPVKNSNSEVHNTQVNIPLQLFCSSPEDNSSPQKKENSCKYFSSDGSNQNEDRSPYSSPSVELFPVKPPKQPANQDRISRGTNSKVQSFDLFGSSNKCVEVDFFRGSPNHTEHASPGSDNISSSSSNGAQDRTGRILFKLFDKDPSNLPVGLRTEMLTWLSNSPSQIESYIRPGCVVLSIYVSMPSTSWEQLEQNLLEHVSWLLQRTDNNIWRDGRFLVQTGKQLASHNNGKLRMCKSWMTPKAPELISISPLAIVSGRETTINLRGRNFNSGTKVHCTFMGGYITKEISDAEVQDSICNGTRLCNSEMHIAAPSGVGRYFIEVENGFKGNSFPIIIADSNICKELRQLEFEFEGDTKLHDDMSEKQESDVSLPKTEVLHFLNELGWLFQMKKDPSKTLEYSIYRFKYLLTFSVEKDFSVVVKNLLNILVEDKMGSDGIPADVAEMVSTIQLLHCAVRRKCRKMVDMLINYSIVSHGQQLSKTYAFPPNLVGPGGLTPLHIAACTSESEDMVDALTSDPLELGLSSWESQLDESGKSPSAYAASRNNHSYNRLVARKLADKRNNQISLSVVENDSTMEKAWIEQPSPAVSHHTKHKTAAASCSKCAIITARLNRRALHGSSHGMVARPFILSMLAIAAVCVCVCLYFRGHPYTGMGSPFTWEKLDYGTI